MLGYFRRKRVVAINGLSSPANVSSFVCLSLPAAAGKRSASHSLSTYIGFREQKPVNETLVEQCSPTQNRDILSLGGNYPTSG